MLCPDANLKICCILVALVRGCLQFLVNPRLELVSIALEVLEAARLLESIPFVAGLTFELGITTQDLLTPLLDVIHRFQNLDVPWLDIHGSLRLVASACQGIA